ncbi:MAG: hypothetical protein RLZZ200_2114 [Pseudomonadota bacterium]
MEQHGNPGLSAAEAAERLQRDGHNDLPQDAPRSLLQLLREVLSEPMFALLLAASLVYLVIGDPVDAAVLGAFATVSVSITVIQQGRSQRVLDALRDLSSPRALVIRDGIARRIPGREVVIGDLLVLAEGDRIAADGVLLESSGMECDESLLTGESLPVAKCRDPDAGPGARIYSGSLVVRGHGNAIVTATGARSEIGRIGVALRATPLGVPRLQVQVGSLVRRLGIAGAVVSLGVLLLSGLLHGEWLEGVLGGIAVGMSMLPEEFPLVLTVFMVMGAWRLSRSRVLARRASTIEALGAATVLCTDKTGTLTVNRIRVQALEQGAARWLPAEGHEVLLAQPGLLGLLQTAQAASDRAAYDPIDAALLSENLPHRGEGLQSLQDYPMQPGRPFLGRAWRRPDGVILVAVKGAPEAVLSLCGLPDGERDDVLGRVAALASGGARVLAVASGQVIGAGAPSRLEDATLEFGGLVAFADPLRDTVPAAVRVCREAGIRIVMITGDHPETARSIAREAGIPGDIVVTGDRLESLDDAGFAVLARSATLYARITPRQKLRIVETLKASGEVVAMTGDGVNDAPALKAANIGIAMGSRGSDVAREASGLVLLDDDFGVIVGAVRLGRRIYENLRKAMSYILAIHVPIAGIALLPLAVGAPMLLTPMTVALLELVIDPACSVVLEAEPEDASVMQRPPRDPQAPLFSSGMLWWSLLQGVLVLCGVGACLLWSWAQGADVERLRAVALLALVGANFLLIDSSRRTGTRGVAVNGSYRVAVVLVVLLLGLLFGWAPLRGLLHLPLPAGRDLLAVAVVAAVLWLTLAGLRRLRWTSALR